MVPVVGLATLRRALGAAMPPSTQSCLWNFRWRDLQHCWVSWLVQHGTPLHVVQEMGGWEFAQMVQRYAHLSPVNRVNLARTQARTIDAVVPCHGTFAAQSHK